MKKKLIKLLNYELDLLDKATVVLKQSFGNCKKIGLKKEYTEKELIEFEAITSRFARASDIFIQQVLRLIDELELEETGTIRDRINRAEKREIISSAEKLADIRITRNKIVHTYSPPEIKKIFKDVMKHSPYLISSVGKVKTYCKKLLTKK